MRFPRATRSPLYRQSRIYARSGLELDRSILAGWVGKAAFHLGPVYDRLKAALKTSNNLGLDETTVRVLDPGRGKTKTGYLWTMARDQRAWSGADPPGVAYEYAPGRSGKHGERLLEGFRGTVQIDGYSGHNRLARPNRAGGALTRAACWVHARRGLETVFDSNGSPIAKAGLDRIAQLYAIEKKIRGKPPATRQFVRWTETAPLVNAFGLWLAEQRSLVSLKSRLGEKLSYIANQWDGLLVFLRDGRVEMDSNFVENRIRPIKLTAKNALFAGHDEGARAWGRIASLIETCKMNGVEPYAWLKDTLEKIAGACPCEGGGPPQQPHRRPTSLELHPAVKLKAGCPSRTAYIPRETPDPSSCATASVRSASFNADTASIGMCTSMRPGAAANMPKSSRRASTASSRSSWPTGASRWTATVSRISPDRLP